MNDKIIVEIKLAKKNNVDLIKKKPAKWYFQKEIKPELEKKSKRVKLVLELSW